MGSFNNYVNKWRWVGGQSIVYGYKVSDLILFTTYVCSLRVGRWSKMVKILFMWLLDDPLIEMSE